MKTNRIARWIKKTAVALALLVFAAVALAVFQVSTSLTAKIPQASPDALYQQGMPIDVNVADLLAAAGR